MPHITIDDAQAKVIAQSEGTIEVRDSAGNRVGYFTHAFSAEDILIARQRLQANEPKLTTRELLEYLPSLAPE